jgi:hypothetical protein
MESTKSPVVEPNEYDTSGVDIRQNVAPETLIFTGANKMQQPSQEYEQLYEYVYPDTIPTAKLFQSHNEFEDGYPIHISGNNSSYDYEPPLKKYKMHIEQAQQHQEFVWPLEPRHENLNTSYYDEQQYHSYRNQADNFDLFDRNRNEPSHEENYSQFVRPHTTKGMYEAFITPKSVRPSIFEPRYDESTHIVGPTRYAQPITPTRELNRSRQFQDTLLKHDTTSSSPHRKGTGNSGIRATLTEVQDPFLDKRRASSKQKSGLEQHMEMIQQFMYKASPVRQPKSFRSSKY